MKLSAQSRTKEEKKNHHPKNLSNFCAFSKLDGTYLLQAIVRYRECKRDVVVLLIQIGFLAGLGSTVEQSRVPELLPKIVWN